MLKKIINTYLGLDPESKQRLQKLKGRVITVELLPFHLLFQLTFHEDSVDLQNHESLPADTKIIGTPLQMVGIMLHKENRQQFFKADLTMEGDAELGQQVIELFDDLQIDWEEILANVLGDVPSHHLGNTFRRFGNWVSSSGKTIIKDVNEYVHEEAEWFPTEEALQDFFTDIDNTRMDVDRIEARIQLLKMHLTRPEEK